MRRIKTVMMTAMKSDGSSLTVRPAERSHFTLTPGAISPQFKARHSPTTDSRFPRPETTRIVKAATISVRQIAALKAVTAEFFAEMDEIAGRI
ncbi:MAG: hypothetical protein FJX59_16545 [Alphaproteobacteria bacterium]|nr:hypothetical protein [Alphaproteobacteria bacterium]